MTAVVESGRLVWVCDERTVSCIDLCTRGGEEDFPRHTLQGHSHPSRRAHRPVLGCGERLPTWLSPAPRGVGARPSDGCRWLGRLRLDAQLQEEEPRGLPVDLRRSSLLPSSPDRGSGRLRSRANSRGSPKSASAKRDAREVSWVPRSTPRPAAPPPGSSSFAQARLQPRLFTVTVATAAAQSVLRSWGSWEDLTTASFRSRVISGAQWLDPNAKRRDGGVCKPRVLLAGLARFTHRARAKPRSPPAALICFFKTSTQCICGCSC